MRKLILYAIVFAATTNLSIAQSDVINQYIIEGIENNLALQRYVYNYEKSLYALKEARGFLFPSISLDARATTAQGGRTIDFPIGDLMNPVYSTLNQLTSSNDFPQVENEEIEFLRPFEQETKVSVIQPVFNPSIYYNNKIHKELIQSKKIDRNIYERNLITEIKAAYFNYLKTNKVSELLNDTRNLLLENIRVNESLYKNDKITIDNVYRSKAELSKLDQQIAEADKNHKLTQQYFNFLLNKPLETEIEIDQSIGNILPDLPIQENVQQIASNRNELNLINSYKTANNLNLQLQQAEYMPTMAFAAEYGFQGEEYSFTSDDDYILASVVLKWNLFSGFQREAKIQQAKIDNYIIQNQYDEVSKQLELQITSSYMDLLASSKAIVASKSQHESAEKAYLLIEKKYSEGQANLLQYIDAQTTMSNARENYWISIYDYHIKLAEYEKQIEKQQ